MNRDQMIEQYLQSQSIPQELIKETAEFRNQYEIDSLVKERCTAPEVSFYGSEILEMAITALLRGQNLLLSGEIGRAHV